MSKIYRYFRQHRPLVERGKLSILVMRSVDDWKREAAVNRTDIITQISCQGAVGWPLLEFKRR